MARKSEADEQKHGAAQSDKNEAVTEAQMDQATADTGEALSEEPKKTVRLHQTPPNSTDAPLADEVVVVNGYTYQIQRGVDVEVPETVRDILEQSGRL